MLKQVFIIGRDAAEVRDRIQKLSREGKIGNMDVKRHSVIGTPEECVQRIGERVEIGVDRFMLSFHESATDLAGIRLFGEEVLPS